jgi:tetratricopeptide (TPR) repeat protein
MTDATSSPGVAAKSGPAEAYVVSLLSEGKLEAAFRVVNERDDRSAFWPEFHRCGVQALASGDLPTARDAFEKARTLDDQQPQVWHAIGVTQLRQGQLGPAEFAFRMTLEIAPDLADAWCGLGMIAQRRGKTAEAVNCFGRALGADPGHRTSAQALQAMRGGKHRGSSKGRRVGSGIHDRVDAALARYRPHTEGNHAAPPVSVCMIVKNEEQGLARCLDSVREIADEVVVVDTGSTDATVEIAEAHGAQVSHFDWCDDFSAARNTAIERARHDWVLIMDGDDELEPGGARALRRALIEHPEAQVCSLRTRIPHGSHTGMSIIDHPRLFRRDRGLRFAGAVHEQVVWPDGTAAAAEVATGVTVYHHGYVEGDDPMAERDERNLRILLRRVETHPDDAWAQFNLGHHYYARGDMAEAVGPLRRALDLSDQGRPLRARAFTVLSGAHLTLGDLPAAESVAREGLAQLPEYPELHFALGAALRKQDRVEEAEAAFEAATRGWFGGVGGSHDFTCRDLKPRLHLAEICAQRGDLAAAESHLREALFFRPESENARRMLARVTELAAAQSPLRPRSPESAALLAESDSLREAGRHDDAITSYERILERHPQETAAWLGLARSYMEKHVYQASTCCFEMALKTSGGAPEVLAEIRRARQHLQSLAAGQREVAS